MHTTDDDGGHFGSLRSGLWLSVVSVVWTAAAGSAALTLGVSDGSLVLAALGAIGLIDGVGSATLIVHFRHAIGHRALSERLERRALRVVTVGMAAAGLATAVISVDRLVAHRGGHPVIAGVALSAVSAVVLSALALRKRRTARRIPSTALLADAWLSGIGALLAAVTVVGTALLEAFRWWWLDPAAAAALGAAALVVSAALARGLRSDPGTASGSSYMS